MIFRMIFVLIIGFYTSRVILDLLGVIDYGVFNLVAGFVAMFGFLNASLTNGIQRFYNFELGRNSHTGANAILNSAVLIQVLLALIIFLPAEIIGIWYIENKMVLPAERVGAAKLLYQFSLITFIIHVVQVPFSAAIIAHEKMGFYAITSFLQAFITLVLVLLLKYIQGDYLVLYGFIVSLVAILIFLLNVIYCKVSFIEVYVNLKSIKRSKLMEMMTFSGWNIFGTVGHIMKDQGVNILLNLFFGPVVNAARGIANQVSGGVTSFVMNIAIPANPQIVQSYAADDKERSISLMQFISKICCFVLVAISLPVLLEINYILEIWLGNTVPAHTSWFVIIVIANSFILTLNSSISSIVHASGKMKLYQLSGGSFSFVSVVAVYIALISNAAPEWALLTLPLSDCFRQAAAVLILRKIEPEFSISKYIRAVIVPFTLVVILASCTLYIIHLQMNEGIFRLITVTVSSIICTMFYSYLFGLSANERSAVDYIVFNKFRVLN